MHLTLVMLTTAALAAAVAHETVNFEANTVGQPPAGWTATRTGSGSERWTVEKDDSAPSRSSVLKQSGTATYPVCFKNDTSLTDGFVEVKLKPVSGKEDQAGGVVWRLRDANNYYLARANALEDNVSVYHVVNGRRTERKSARLKVAGQAWHMLRVDFRAEHFTVTFDGANVIEWDDATFKEPGHVGVWTKADSVTLFDDFAYGGP